MRYLWKEWRDNRAVVLGFLVAFPVLPLLAALVLPKELVGDPHFTHFTTVAAAIGLSVVALAVAGDLFPGESRRGTLFFLARTPHGLGAVFLAKTAFLLLAAAGFTGYAFGTAWLVQTVLIGVAHVPDERVSQLGPLAVCFVLWVYAVSTWLPRGALALPATALVLGLFALPLYLIWNANPGMAPFRGAETFLRWVLTGGALVVAWLGFARGRRFSRGAWASAWRGLLATTLLFAPAWGYSAVEAREYRYFDAGSDRLVMHEAYLGVGGRTLFVNGSMVRPYGKSPRHAFVVDLEDGSWRKVGGPEDYFLPVGEYGAPEWRTRRTRALTVVARSDAGTRDRGKSWMHYHDGRLGDEIKSGWSSMRFPEVESRQPRAPAHVPKGLVAARPAGLGYRVDGGYYDPFRKRVYRNADLPVFRRVLIRPGSWIALRGFGPTRPYKVPYVFYDPDTGETTPADGLRYVRWLLDDGRAAMAGHRNARIADPDAGTVVELDVPRLDRIARMPDGALLVGCPADHRYARLDQDTLKLAPIPALDGARFKLIAFEDDGAILVIRKNRIVRARLGADAHEVLFPR